MRNTYTHHTMQVVNLDFFNHIGFADFDRELVQHGHRTIGSLHPRSPVLLTSSFVRGSPKRYSGYNSQKNSSPEVFMQHSYRDGGWRHFVAICVLAAVIFNLDTAVDDRALQKRENRRAGYIHIVQQNLIAIDTRNNIPSDVSHDWRIGTTSVTDDCEA